MLKHQWLIVMDLIRPGIKSGIFKHSIIRNSVSVSLPDENLPVSLILSTLDSLSPSRLIPPTLDHYRFWATSGLVSWGLASSFFIFLFLVQYRRLSLAWARGRGLAATAKTVTQSLAVTQPTDYSDWMVESAYKQNADAVALVRKSWSWKMDDGEHAM